MRLALALLVASTAQAAADPPKLKLTHEPPPRTLRMRPRMAAVSAQEPAPSSTAVAAPYVTATATEAELGQIRDLRRPISVRFNLGYVVDGTALTGGHTINDRRVSENRSNEDFARIRAYAVGEGYFSSRGVLLPSLSTYFAARFQITRPRMIMDPRNPTAQVPVTAPIANWFDRSGFEGRAGWGEIKDFLPDKRLAPLRIRAGELYVYGPWVSHIYGLVAAWEGKLVRGSIYTGSRVPDYTNVSFVEGKDRAVIGGSSARLDLTALKTPIPFAISGEVLAFTAAGASEDEQGTTHAKVQVDWRPRRDVALIGQLRALDGELANEHIQLRSRYKQVTNLVLDVTHRRRNDWRWDPSVTKGDPLQANRRLDLGPVLPQLLLSGRAGTLIYENVDVLLRGAYANDLVSAEIDRNTYAASYFEVGGGLEVRLRRTVGVGLFGLTRQTQRYAEIEDQIPDVPNEIDPIPRQYGPEMGETGFTELGTTVRMSLGARRLSALAEIYGRRTRYARAYCAAVPFASGGFDTSCMDETAEITASDYRGGGRVTVDAWIGSQLRLFASYELTGSLDFAPEISGYKSLRLMMEGVY